MARAFSGSLTAERTTSWPERPKDDADFAAALPVLDERARAWLDDALALVHPEHVWRERLR